MKELSDMHLNSHKIPRIMIVAGGKDKIVPPWHSQELAKYLKPLEEDGFFKLRIFDNQPHVCFRDSDYPQVISEFIAKALRDY